MHSFVCFLENAKLSASSGGIRGLKLEHLQKMHKE